MNQNKELSHCIAVKNPKLTLLLLLYDNALNMNLIYMVSIHMLFIVYLTVEYLRKMNGDTSKRGVVTFSSFFGYFTVKKKTNRQRKKEKKKNTVLVKWVQNAWLTVLNGNCYWYWVLKSREEVVGV